MNTLGNLARYEEPIQEFPENVVDFQKYLEAKRTQENAQLVIEEIRLKTGVDTSDAEVGVLPENVGGQFEVENAQTTINEKIVPIRESLRLVVAHETYHAINLENAKQRDDLEVFPAFMTELIEDLTERLVEQNFGQRSSKQYKNYMSISEKVASINNTSVRELAKMYEEGRNYELVSLYLSAFPDTI